MFLLKKYKYFVLLSLLIVIIIIVTQNMKSNNAQILEASQQIPFPLASETSEEETKIEQIVWVEIKGEVLNPGIYQLDLSQRVMDVINLAGGLTEDADTTLINLAKKVSDEMVVIVYSKQQVANSNIKETVIQVVEKECICPNIQNDGCLNTKIDEEISNTTTTNEMVASEGGISLNKANQEELQTIPGIGETKALAIIKYRDENDGFKSIEELLKVDGIGQATYEKIKIYFTL